MSRIGAFVLALAMSASGLAAGGAGYRLEARRSVDDAEPRRLEKVLIVAISDDREVRNRFEDKFVTHLGARGIEAVTSHSLVPSLTAIGDRDRILAALEREGVDGAVTVRAVGLDESGEEEWTAAWAKWVGEVSTVRELIERTLPVPPKKAKRYGVEFALWDTRPARLLWAARTGTCTRKQLQSGVADLLQLAIDGLKDARRL